MYSKSGSVEQEEAEKMSMIPESQSEIVQVQVPILQLWQDIPAKTSDGNNKIRINKVINFFINMLCSPSPLALTKLLDAVCLSS